MKLVVNESSFEQDCTKTPFPPHKQFRRRLGADARSMVLTDLDAAHDGSWLEGQRPVVGSR